VAKDWIKFYGLTGDPFAIRPLESEDDFRTLFIKTEEISTHIDPVVDHFAGSSSFITVIAGAKGLGKSTVLHYVMHRVRNQPSVVVAYVVHQPPILEGQQSPAYGVGLDTMIRILIELAKSTVRLLGVKAPKEFAEFVQKLGIDSKTGLVESDLDRSFSYDHVSNLLDTLISHLERLGLSALVAIDNYDRLDEKRAIEFLRSQYAQPLFERIRRRGSVLIAADDEWARKLTQNPSTNYLGRPVFLSPLNPVEAKKLILTRMLAKRQSDAQVPPDQIFEDSALYTLTVRKNGIARTILESCRGVMVFAAKRDEPRVSEATVKEFLEREERVGERYYERIKSNELALNGLFFILRVKEGHDSDNFRVFLSGLCDAYEGRGVSIEIRDSLRTIRAVWLSPEQQINIDFRIKALFDAISADLSLRSFLDWLARGDATLLLVPTAKEQESRTEFDSQMRLFLDAYRRQEVRESLKNGQIAFQTWIADIDTKEYDTARTLTSVWTCVQSVSLAAYYAKRIFADRSSVVKRPSGEVLQEFLISSAEAAKEVVYDFVTIRNYYELADRGLPLQPSAIEDIHVRAQRVILVLFDILRRTMAFVRPELQKIPLHRARSIEELEERLRPYLRQDDRYLYSWLLGGDNLDFLTLSWVHKNFVYTLVCGGYELVRKLKLNSYETEPFFLPYHIDTEVKANSLSKSKMLRYGNTLEFARSIAALSETQPVVLVVSSFHQLAQLTVSTPHKNEFAISLEFGTPAYHQKLDTLRLALSRMNKEDDSGKRTHVEETRVEAYRQVGDIEMTLIELMRKELRSISPNWWIQRIPPDVQKDCHDRKLRDERPPWRLPADASDSDFLNFSDLEKIFLRGDNWKEAFKRIFRDETFLSQKLRELQFLRNAIMHPTRPLDQKDVGRLKLDADDLLNAIKKNKPS